MATNSSARASDLGLGILDFDSVPNKDDGNTYRASGKDAVPTRLEFSASIVPAGVFAVHYIISVTKSAVLKQLVLKTYGDKKQFVILPASLCSNLKSPNMANFRLRRQSFVRVRS